MEKEKRCFNCRYYSAHYVKSDGGMFMELPHRGHCINHNWSLTKSAKIIDRQGICEFWEDQSIKIEKRKNSIISNLEFMQQHLCHIEQMLRDDFNKIK